jgi:diguanylate cyclase (GGDEF)-like protein
MTYKKSSKEDVVNLLHQLNYDLKRLIRGYVELSSEPENWDTLSSMFKPIRCYEIKGCTNEKCPAYKSANYRCWLQVGTLCGCEVQGKFAKKYKTCFECDVFSIISQETVRALYENINTIIFYLKNRDVKFRELAIKDQLTNLYNRHFFNEIIEMEMAKIERNDQIISFIMIDLDNLKHINDTLGHLAGDRMLVETAKLIKDTIRRSDFVFRFGGDEFLVLLLNADCNIAINTVERLLDAVDGWNKDNADAYGCRLSLSIGCSTCDKGCNALDTLKEADARMYHNKREKRNNAEMKNPAARPQGSSL